MTEALSLFELALGNRGSERRLEGVAWPAMGATFVARSAATWSLRRRAFEAS